MLNRSSCDLVTGAGWLRGASRHPISICGSLAQRVHVVVQRGVASRAGAVRAFVSSMPPHVCSRRGCPPTPRLCAAGAGGVTTVDRCASAAAELRPTARTYRTSPRGSLRHCTDKAGNIYYVPLYICRVVLLLLNVCPRQGRRSPTPRFCVTGAGGVTTVETFVRAAAKLRPATRTRRKYIQ
jgi:hypothetical protein